MGEPNLNLFRFLSENFKIDTFFESGSGRGETIKKVFNIFNNIYTVELAYKLYDYVSKKYSNKANCFYGKSVDILETILPIIDTPILYWLDAHWSLDQTAGEKEQCMLINELEMINSRPNNDDYIFIDDAHLFFSPAVLKPPYRVDEWPNINDIFTCLNKKNRYNFILFSWRCAKHGDPKGIVFPENVICSVPEHAKDKVYNYIKTFQLEGN